MNETRFLSCLACATRASFLDTPLPYLPPTFVSGLEKKLALWASTDSSTVTGSDGYVAIVAVDGDIHPKMVQADQRHRRTKAVLHIGCLWYSQKHFFCMSQPGRRLIIRGIRDTSDSFKSSVACHSTKVKTIAVKIFPHGHRPVPGDW